MDPLTIIGLIQAGTKFAAAIGPLVEQGSHVFSSDDEAEIKAALAQLQAANESLHSRVQSKLRGTA